MLSKLKKIGVLGLMLSSAALLHPAKAGAQEYGRGYGYTPQYRTDGRFYGGYREGRREREWREHEWREQERRERRWQRQEWREHERWERNEYRAPYGYPY